MTKRLGFLLVALLIVPMLLAGCDSESPEKAEEYMNAVLAGEVEEAQALACDDEAKAMTAEAAAAYANLNKDMAIDTEKTDLKYDIGKGMNNKEVIVTGALIYVFNQDVAASATSDIEVEYELTEKLGSFVILQLDKEGDDWCVTKESSFGILRGETLDAATDVEDADAGADVDDAADTTDVEDADADATSAEDATEEAAEATATPRS